MNTKSWLVTALSFAAIGTVVYVILTDLWFHQTLIGRGVAIVILSGGAFAIWLGGVCHGMGLRDD